MSLYFFSIFLWLFIVFSKTEPGNRALLLLLCSLFTIFSMSSILDSFNLCLIIYIFIGDILVVILITCMGSSQINFNFSIWEILLILTLIFSTHFYIFFYSSLLSLMKMNWMFLALFVMTFALIFFSKVIPKSQNRLI